MLYGLTISPTRRHGALAEVLHSSGNFPSKHQVSAAAMASSSHLQAMWRRLRILPPRAGRDALDARREPLQDASSHDRHNPKLALEWSLS